MDILLLVAVLTVTLCALICYQCIHFKVMVQGVYVNVLLCAVVHFGSYQKL
jgi:hypothetical protein